jgi:hypothetical protein
MSLELDAQINETFVSQYFPLITLAKYKIKRVYVANMSKITVQEIRFGKHNDFTGMNQIAILKHCHKPINVKNKKE